MTAPTSSVAKRTIDTAGWASGVALAVGVFVLSWLRHQHGWSGHDLAIFDQASWQLAHGRAHISIIERHILADHFSPILYPISFLYRVAPTPAWLLGVQALAIGATMLPLRAIATHLGQPPLRATLLLVMSSPLLAAGLFDFHPSTLAVPFVAVAVLGALTDRPALSVTAAIAVGLCRADLAPVVLGVALVATPRVRWRLGAVAVAMLVVSTTLPSRFGDTNDIWFTWFGHLGTGPLDAALHPWRAARHLLGAQHLGVLMLWIAASGFGLLRRPRWLLAVLVAGMPVLLSRWEGTGLPWYHYGAPIVPLAIAGALDGLAAAAESTDRWSERLRAGWWLGPVLVLGLASPLSPLAPESNRIWTVAFGNDGRDVRGAVALVEDHESVSADQRVLSHLSEREHAYLYPIPFAPAPDFFPIGSEPDLDSYEAGEVDVVVAPVGFEYFVPADLYAERGRVDGYVIFERVDGAGPGE